MTVRLIIPTDLEPVTLQEAKDHLRIEHALDDSTILTLISAARQYVEQICWRSLMPETWELSLDGFPAGGELELPKGNLVAVNFVRVNDADGIEQTIDPSQYVVDINSVPGRLRLGYGASWPSTRAQWDAVRIEYDVGWDFDAGVWAGPRPLKQAVLLLVSQMYEHRTPEVVGTIVSSVSFAAEALMAPYRLFRY